MRQRAKCCPRWWPHELRPVQARGDGTEHHLHMDGCIVMGEVPVVAVISQVAFRNWHIFTFLKVLSDRAQSVPRKLSVPHGRHWSRHRSRHGGAATCYMWCRSIPRYIGMSIKKKNTQTLVWRDVWFHTRPFFSFFFSLTEAQENNPLGELMNAPRRRSGLGDFHVRSQGVTEDLSVGKDFGRARCFPRARAESSLWALHGLRNTVYGGVAPASLAAVVFGVRDTSLPSLRLSRGNDRTSLFWRIFVRVSVVVLLLTCALDVCSFVVRFPLPGALARSHPCLLDCTRRCPLVQGPPVCLLSRGVFLTAGPRPFSRCLRPPFLRVSPDFQIPPSAISLAVSLAGNVFWSAQRVSLTQAKGWLLSCLSRLDGARGSCCCCPVLACCHFGCLDRWLLGCVMLLFGFRKCLLGFLWAA